MRRLADRLVEGADTEGRIWFAVWGGWSQFHEQPPSRGARVIDAPAPMGPRRLLPSPKPPLIEVGGRQYHVFAGSTAEATALSPWGLSPNLWWPESREWFVNTDVDATSTYVGGPAEVLQRVVDDPDLGALSVAIFDAIVW